MNDTDPQTTQQCKDLARMIAALGAASRQEPEKVSSNLLLHLTTERLRRILRVAGIPKEDWKSAATMVIVLCFLDDSALDIAAAGSGAAPFILDLCRRAYDLCMQSADRAPRATGMSSDDVVAIRHDIDQLPRIDREAIRRSYWNGERIADIAQDMRLPFSIVAMTVLRFRARIRRYLFDD